MKTASWIIREKATGAAVLETYNKRVADAINKEKYEAVPALQHLQELNRKLKGYGHGRT